MQNEKLSEKKTNLDKYGFREIHSDGDKDANSNESPCDKCKKDVVSGDKAMSCDVCSTWSHISCIKGMTVPVYDALVNGNKSSGLKWFCPNCLDRFLALEKMGKAKVEPTCTIGTQTTAVIQNEQDSPLEVNDAEEAGSSNLERYGNNTGNGKFNVHTFRFNQNREESKPLPICKGYRYGRCTQGANCKFSHPAKCLRYCRNGRDGCGEGFRTCNLLHPVLSRNSLNYKHCFDPDCTLTHLKGTIRKVDEGIEFGIARFNNMQRQYDQTFSGTIADAPMPICEYMPKNTSGPLPMVNGQQSRFIPFPNIEQPSVSLSRPNGGNMRPMQSHKPTPNDFLDLKHMLLQLKEQVASLAMCIPGMQVLPPSMQKQATCMPQI